MAAVKKLKGDMSGFCRHSGFHDKCWGEWETPSVVVRCECECHKGQMRQTDRVIVAKVKKQAAKQAADQIVPKMVAKKGSGIVPKVLVKKS